MVLGLLLAFFGGTFLLTIAVRHHALSNSSPFPPQSPCLLVEYLESSV